MLLCIVQSVTETFWKKRNTSVFKQLMADLPSLLLQVLVDQPLFSHEEVDYLVSFRLSIFWSFMKQDGGIFVFMTIRSVNIELYCTPSRDSFLCALLKFISRRKYSDNETNLSLHVVQVTCSLLPQTVFIVAG